MSVKLHPDTVLMASRGVRIALREAGISPTRVIIEMSSDNFTRLKLATSTDKLNAWSANACEVDNVVFCVDRSLPT
jgi:hypothetical protein